MMLIHKMLGLLDVNKSDELRASEKIVKIAYRACLGLAVDADEQSVNVAYLNIWQNIFFCIQNNPAITPEAKMAWELKANQLTITHHEYHKFLAAIAPAKFTFSKSNIGFLQKPSTSKKASVKQDVLDVYVLFKQAINNNKIDEIELLLARHEKLIEEIYALKVLIQRRTIFPELYLCGDDIFNAISKALPNLEKVDHQYRNDRKIRFLREALSNFLALSENNRLIVFPRLLNIINQLNLKNLDGFNFENFDELTRLFKTFIANYKEVFMAHIYSELHESLALKVIPRFNYGKRARAETTNPESPECLSKKIKTTMWQEPKQQNDLFEGLDDEQVTDILTELSNQQVLY